MINSGPEGTYIGNVNDGTGSVEMPCPIVSSQTFDVVDVGLNPDGTEPLYDELRAGRTFSNGGGRQGGS